MIFQETDVRGVFVIDLEPRRDERGFFARSWCADEFAARGLATSFPQSNVSFSNARNTLRGLHYQDPPYAEAKLVRCTRGRIFDVALDLRPFSPTYCRWFAAELTAEDHRMLYIPEGCAHGYQTLDDSCEVTYLVSQLYAPEAERGVRWDDPAFAIQWPDAPARIISPRDAAFPDYAVGERQEVTWTR